MKQDNINSTLVYISQHIPSERIPQVKIRLETANDSAFSLILSQKMINPVMVVLFGVFFGFCGVDRFFTHDYGLGVLRIGMWLGSIIGCIIVVVGGYFVVVGGCIVSIIALFVLLALGIWIIIDACTASNRCKMKNFIEIIKVIDLAGEDYSHDNGVNFSSFH